MNDKVTLKIDGKEVEAEKGMTILQVARANGVEIPTLCYNEQLKPFGGCRMCSVEIVRGGRKRLVASCVYPVEEDLEVVTNDENIRKVRRMIMELLLPLAPTGPIKDLAAKYGLRKADLKQKLQTVFSADSAYVIALRSRRPMRSAS